LVSDSATTCSQGGASQPAHAKESNTAAARPGIYECLVKAASGAKNGQLLGMMPAEEYRARMLNGRVLQGDDARIDQEVVVLTYRKVEQAVSQFRVLYPVS
jgi:hypothetical protein